MSGHRHSVSRFKALGLVVVPERNICQIGLLALAVYRLEYGRLLVLGAQVTRVYLPRLFVLIGDANSLFDIRLETYSCIAA